MNIKKITPNQNHEDFRNESIDLLKKHASNLPAQELLALASQIVGQILAMQDQTIMTTDIAMQIVSRNIEVGNAEFINRISDTIGSA